MSLHAPTIRAIVHTKQGVATGLSFEVRDLPDVGAVLVGEPATTALARVVAVHGVCAKAHAAAGAGALRAAGVEIDAVERSEVVDEARREALLSLAREPARLLGGEVSSEHLIGVLRGPRPEAALIGLVGADPQRLAADWEAVEAWLTAGATPLARLVAGTAALPTGGSPAMVGALARHRDVPTVRRALDERRGGLARGLARLIDLGALVRGEPGSVGLVEAGGTNQHANARVETARGMLQHDVEIDDDGNVVAWTLDRPTFRALREEDLLPCVVGKAVADAVQAAQLQLASLDPCFSWRVDPVEA